jgi:hypothetical protein
LALKRPLELAIFDRAAVSRTSAALLFSFLLAIAALACATTPTPDEFAQLLDRAESGRVSAQTQVAFRYMTGRGVAQSEKQAARWYTAAARQGDPAAMSALKELGRPVPRSLASFLPGTIAGGTSGLGSGSKLDFGSYHALVIGNADYHSFPKLVTTRNDARAVADTLRDDYGFEVTTLLDATWAEMRQSLSSYRKTLTEDDSLLIYYAGHGWQDEKAEEAYWMPVDADPQSDVYWISNATLSTTLRAIEARHIMIVADSCFSGTLVRGLSIQQDGGAFLEQLNSRRSRTAMTSGGVEPVVDSGANGHSVFANAFLDALSKNRGVIDATALFAQIRRPVMVSADQTPSYGDIRKAGHDNGDFLFYRVSDPDAEGQGVGQEQTPTDVQP